MKKVLLGIFSLFLVSSSLVAQEDAAKIYKKAARAYSAFNVDPSSNADKLTEAKNLIDQALKSEEMSAMGKVWQTKGDIYSTSVSQDIVKNSIDQNHAIENLDGAVIANEAYLMALKKAVKKFETKDALTGITSNINNLSNIGIINYQAQKPADAATNFIAVLDAHKALKEGGMDSPLDGADSTGITNYNNAVYLCAIATLSAGDMEAAGKYYDELAANNHKDAAVYDGIYKTNIDTNPEKALAALEKGRELFPEETSLLFTEINYYLREGKMDVLTGKLETAISKEPDNSSLYSTLGNVYDNLAQGETDATKSGEYFNLAMKNYNTAIEKDASNNDAVYSIGALYYNKAAMKITEREALSISAQKEYNALTKEIDDLFAQALPFFQKVEKVNPNDRNTLIALKEIFAKQNNFEATKEFKNRLQVLTDGGKNETSYFK